MYNISSIIECLTGFIGFERPYDASQPAIDSDLATSESGVYVSPSLHPLLSYDNIWTVAEQFNKITPPAYSADVSYSKGVIVVSGSTFYQSRVNNNVGNPVGNNANWRQTTLYSAYLRRKYEGSISNLFSRLATEKKLHEVGKTLLDNVNLYEGVGNINGRISKNSRFVGLKITLKNPDTVARLNKIGLQIDTVQSGLLLYLFHSSQATPVKTFTINQTKSVSFQWHSVVSEVLSFLSDDVNAGGSYYLGYYEDDLTGQAIKKDISFYADGGCGTCSDAIMNRNLRAKWGKFIGIQPFYVNSSDLPDVGELWDEEREMHVDENTWGLNFQLSIQCDLTNWVCQNKNVLIEPLSRQLAVDFLNEMAYSVRDNQRKEKLAGLAAVALDNQENGASGELRRLSGAIKALSFDFSNLSGLCAPCNKASSTTRMGSVWGK